MRILFFDTETNGKPKNYKAPSTEVEAWPRITEIAWIVTDIDFEPQDAKSYLIYPDGWEVPTEQFFLDQGITTEYLKNGGIPIGTVLSRFAEAIDSCDVMVAHNIAFDTKVIGAEMHRLGAGYYPKTKPWKFCTMLASTTLLNIPGQYGPKWPKLSELVMAMTGEDPTGTHRAIEDVRWMIKATRELHNRGHLIVLEDGYMEAEDRSHKSYR